MIFTYMAYCLSGVGVIATYPKTLYFQGFSLKGTKIDQWVKAGTG